METVKNIYEKQEDDSYCLPKVNCTLPKRFCTPFIKGQVISLDFGSGNGKSQDYHDGEDCSLNRFWYVANIAEYVNIARARIVLIPIYSMKYKYKEYSYKEGRELKTMSTSNINGQKILHQPDAILYSEYGNLVKLQMTQMKTFLIDEIINNWSHVYFAPQMVVEAVDDYLSVLFGIEEPSQKVSNYGYINKMDYSVSYSDTVKYEEATEKKSHHQEMENLSDASKEVQILDRDPIDFSKIKTGAKSFDIDKINFEKYLTGAFFCTVIKGFSSSMKANLNSMAYSVPSILKGIEKAIKDEYDIEISLPNMPYSILSKKCKEVRPKAQVIGKELFNGKEIAYILSNAIHTTSYKRLISSGNSGKVCALPENLISFKKKGRGIMWSIPTISDFLTVKAYLIENKIPISLLSDYAGVNNINQNLIMAKRNNNFTLDNPEVVAEKKFDEQHYDSTLVETKWKNI